MRKAIMMPAHAKINLCLNVVGKRSDGYHELEMVMVPLELHDDVHIELADTDSLICDEKDLLLDDSNTITKAVALMRETYSLDCCFQIRLTKRIPMQAGLAGGSSDAAAVMKGINQLLDLHIPIVELAQLGKQIGADVPFCIMNTCAVVKGIGEKIIPIDMNCDFHILLVKPKAGVPTGKAFQMLDFHRCEHPSYEQMQQACEQNDFVKACANLGNSLEFSAMQLVADIANIKEKLKQAGFEGVLMSGSGSTVFGLTQYKDLIDQTIHSFKDESNAFVLSTKIYKE